MKIIRRLFLHLKYVLSQLVPARFRAKIRLFNVFQEVPEYLYLNNYKKIQIHEIPDFASIANSIMGERTTFLKQDRLYTLFQLVSQIQPDTIVVEVGVYKGGSAKFISQVLELLGLKSTVFACDTFTGHAVVDERYDGTHQANIDFADVELKDVQEYLLERKDIQVIPGDIFQTYEQLPTERSIGLLHVDVDVYPATKFCLETFGPRIVSGGFIVCDDYGFTTCKGAKVAVDEFCEANKEWKLLHLLTGQAVLFKLSI